MEELVYRIETIATELKVVGSDQILHIAIENVQIVGSVLSDKLRELGQLPQTELPNID